MNTNTEYYRYFYYVVKYGSISQTAKQLHTNQPNVSRIIHKLEDEIGFPLLERSVKGVSLTPYGKTLYHQICPAIERIIQTESLFDDKKVWFKDHISIGCTSISLHFSLPHLKQFKDKNPNIKMIIKADYTDKIIELVENETVDVAFIDADRNFKTNLQCVKLKQFYDVPACGPAYKEFASETHSLNDLISLPKICIPHDSETYSFWEKYFSEQNMNFIPDLEVTNLDQLIVMAMYNWGIGFLPDFYLEEVQQTAELYAIKLNKKVSPRYVYMITKDTHIMNSIAESIIEYMQQIAI